MMTGDGARRAYLPSASAPEPAKDGRESGARLLRPERCVHQAGARVAGRVLPIRSLHIGPARGRSPVHRDPVRENTALGSRSTRGGKSTRGALPHVIRLMVFRKRFNDTAKNTAPIAARARNWGQRRKGLAEYGVGPTFVDSPVPETTPPRAWSPAFVAAADPAGGVLRVTDSEDRAGRILRNQTGIQSGCPFYGAERDDLCSPVPEH